MRNETSEYKTFNEAMDTILRADPQAVKEAMDAEKRANAEKRKATKKPSALRRAVSDKD